MSQPITKTLSVTRVSYNTVEVRNGIPSFISQPDAILRGNLSSDRVLRILREKHGKDSTVVLTKVESGRHEFEISFEDFVAHARITDDPFSPGYYEGQESVESLSNECTVENECEGAFSDECNEAEDERLGIPDDFAVGLDSGPFDDDLFFSVQDTSGFQKIGGSWW